jgi:hypothetical protein
MKFIIRNNENATKGWKVISNILINWIFMPLFIIQGFARWKIGNKEIFHESFVYKLYTYIGGTAVLISIALNFIHWLNPKWFEYDIRKKWQFLYYF